jgi:hypothetical protein
MDNLAYFIEALHLQLEASPEAGLMTWAQAFDRARDSWQLNLCRRLLREMRAASLPDALTLSAMILTRSAEGMRQAQLEHWGEAIAFGQYLLSGRAPGSRRQCL